MSPIPFEVGIPNLVFECIFGWRSVTYHFWVTVTWILTCDLVFRINHVKSISLVLFYIGIPKLVCRCILGWWSVAYHLRFTVTLTYDLVLEYLYLEHISHNLR